MPPSRHSPVIIIGSGPAGYAAAIYASRALLMPLLFTGPDPGGQLMITTDVENYPGFPLPVQGPWLMKQFLLQTQNLGVKIIPETIIDANLSTRPFQLTTDSGAQATCDALIIATGAKAKWLGVSSENTFKGAGVSACATCDGFFCRGKPVAVIGGGSAAVEEALYLSRLAKHVTIIHRRETFRAEKILEQRLSTLTNVSVLWNTIVTEFQGSDQPRALNALTLENIVTSARSTLPVEGAFIAIGHEPASGPFKKTLPCHEDGTIIVTPGTTRSKIPGVFAAGDVADSAYRQAITAAGMGCMAALDAERWLSSQG